MWRVQGKKDEERGEREEWAFIWVGGSGKEVMFRLRLEVGLRVNHVWSSTKLGESEEVKEACVAGGGKGEGR